MAEGFLKSFNKNLEVFSAGTFPAERVSSKAVQVMKEIGIDISRHYPKNLDSFIDKDFDYVITVCDNAKETCPVFNGKVKNKLHIGFEDPADAIGTEEEVLNIFRKVRDEIKEEFWKLYNNLQAKNQN